MDMLYAYFAWSVSTLLDAFFEGKIDRHLTLRASDACLADARGFVTAVHCELFSSAATKTRPQSPKKRKPYHDTVTSLRQESAAGAENPPSDVISAKRARRCLTSFRFHFR
jgi:hypothetical protein